MEQGRRFGISQTDPKLQTRDVEVPFLDDAEQLFACMYGLQARVGHHPPCLGEQLIDARYRVFTSLCFIMSAFHFNSSSSMNRLEVKRVRLLLYFACFPPVDPFA